MNTMGMSKQFGISTSPKHWDQSDQSPEWWKFGIPKTGVHPIGHGTMGFEAEAMSFTHAKSCGKNKHETIPQSSPCLQLGTTIPSHGWFIVVETTLLKHA